MATMTIYTASADVTLLNAIFNGVAMMCKQTTLIWGFAMLAAMYRLLSTSTVGALGSVDGSGGRAMARGSMSAVMPFIFAMLLTNSALKSQVVVESTLNGKTTAINNVPWAIGAIPAAASIVSNEVGKVVSTAFQAVGTDYPSLSASANGFMNPMKVLLSARTAASRLSGIDSQVRTLVSACLGPDSGADYAAINAIVVNAGNTGATAAQTLPIHGYASTALGALLYQASLNKSGLVAGLTVAGTSVASCADAANLVAQNIDNAVSSPEFARVVQGAVNGMDQPIATADYSVDHVVAEYTALRTANTVANTLAAGAGQAGAEMMNLLFAEMVNTSLNCLQAESTDKVTCEASMLQAAEVERHNIQAAANEVPMLMYAGSFGNYILALIIGLGPVVVMFMMFAGIDSGRCLKAAVHIMVWPLLVVNVGAELVNGMLCVTVANFLTSVTQSGYLSHAATLAAYKELSLQIGTGSHIMASLPVLMSMIFALGETSALVSVANDVRPRDSSIGEQVTPQPIGAAPLLRQNSMASIEQGIGGGFQRITQTGAIDAIASSATFGSQTREAGQSVSAAITRQHTVSEATSDAVRWQQAFSRRDYSSLGIDNSTGESIRHGYESALREGNRDASGSSTSSTRNNANTTAANAGGSLGLKIGAGGIGFDVGASTNTSATDQLTRGHQAGHEDAVEQSKALSRSLNEELTRRKSTGSGNSNDRVLSKSLDTQRNYQDIVSQSGSSTDQTSQALRDSSSFIANSQRIGTAEIADQVATNRDYAMYQVLAGRDFDAQAGSQSYREVAERDMDSGATDRLQGNPAARDAAVRHRAAVLMSQDERASPEARLAALEYLTGSAMAMQHLGFRPFQTKMRSLDIADPSNRTGVNGARVMSGGDQVERAGVHSNVMLPQTNFGSSAADADLRTMHADGTTVKAERERQDLVADNADLGNYGSGTAKRTLVNTAANIAGTDAGAPSRVGVGRPGASPASAVERPRGPRPPAADPAAPAAGAPSGGGQP